MRARCRVASNGRSCRACTASSCVPDTTAASTDRSWFGCGSASAGWRRPSCRPAAGSGSGRAPGWAASAHPGTRCSWAARSASSARASRSNRCKGAGASTDASTSSCSTSPRASPRSRRWAATG